MQIDGILGNSFAGRAQFSNPIGKKEKDFANQILKYEINGISNMELLSKRGFDLDIQSTNSKRTVHPTVDIFSVIRYIIQSGYFKGESNKKYSRPIKIRLEDGVQNGAYALRQHIINTDELIDEKYPTHYYTKWESLKMRIKVFLGKV